MAIEKYTKTASMGGNYRMSLNRRSFLCPNDKKDGKRKEERKYFIYQHTQHILFTVI